LKVYANRPRAGAGDSFAQTGENVVVSALYSQAADALRRIAAPAARGARTGGGVGWGLTKIEPSAVLSGA
jgi:hypothetical protein